MTKPLMTLAVVADGEPCPCSELADIDSLYIPTGGPYRDQLYLYGGEYVYPMIAGSDLIHDPDAIVQPVRLVPMEGQP